MSEHRPSTIALTQDLDRLIERAIASGEFTSKDDVVRAALQLLDRQRSKTPPPSHTQDELREAEERFSKAFNASPHLITISTYEGGRYLEVNDAVLRATGYTREEFLGHSDVELKLYDDIAQRAQVLKMIERTGSIHGLELKLRAKDGHILNVLLYTEIVHMGGVRCILSTSVDITEQRKAEARAESSRQLLLDELNHRVKNTLATVQSIARQTLRLAETPREFMTGFSARLMALARAHDLLTRKEWQGVSLEELIFQTVSPYRSYRGTPQIAMKGDHLELPPNTAVVLNMVLHELATNAAKYGALSKSESVVTIEWTVTRQSGSEPHLTLVWLERGGPPITAAPGRRGFGMRLIERGLGAELNGIVNLDFQPEGLRCEMQLNIRPVKQFEG